MHIKSPFIITLPLMIPCLFASPIYENSRQALIARTMAPTQPVSGYTMPNSRLTSHASNTPASNHQLRVAASPDNAASRFNKLRLTTKSAPGFQKASPSIPCHMPTGRGSSTVCHSGFGSAPMFPFSSHEGTEVSLHPEGKDGADAKTVKKLTVGKAIGYGNRGVVYDVPKHEFGDHDLAAKVYFGDANPVEMDHLRTLGQLHASGKCNGRDCIVMKKAKGVPLMQTQAFKDAEEKRIAMTQIYIKGAALAGNARFNHMRKDGLIHNAMDHDHIMYEVDEKGRPVKANLVGWGNAILAPKRGPEEVYNPGLEAPVRLLYHFTPPFNFPPNRRIGSQPVLPPDSGWDHPKP